MNVAVRCHTSLPGSNTRPLAALTRSVVAEVLLHSKTPANAEVSVLYVGDEEMRGLNERYRGLARPTDVLAFAMTEGQQFPEPDTHLLGDVVISIDTARRQADRRGHSLRREIAVLLVHGVLHLLGHDHEPISGDAAASRRRAREMRDAERVCLELLTRRLVV